MKSCEVGGCEGCEIQAHINCSCSREKKIPLKDLAYIMGHVRYGIGLRPTAAIATAALIDAGIITEDNTSKVIDKSKVKRAQEKLMRELGQEFEEKCREDGGISCSLFDGRIDLTNVMMEAEGIKHSWIEGPRHILFQLACRKSQRKKVLDIVMPTVKRSTWYAHSEAILQIMLCSEDQKERIWGVERNLAVRGDGDPDTQLGDSSVINCDASSIVELISWSEDVSEPPLTCSLSTSEAFPLLGTSLEDDVFSAWIRWLPPPTTIFVMSDVSDVRHSARVQTFLMREERTPAGGPDALKEDWNR
ncbi:hypothetical protein GWK47_002434 [Chionoecetes opilio]|uniref:Uncharacterized protein n=1 Tax=Chionoecetes opilio TaxID=41210 RepID=A0A8J4XNL6_CHIOP|nr:hypothetical protein GWK47_002434 [Chionoecetes opilio]